MLVHARCRTFSVAAEIFIKLCRLAILRKRLQQPDGTFSSAFLAALALQYRCALIRPIACIIEVFTFFAGARSLSPCSSLLVLPRILQNVIST